MDIQILLLLQNIREHTYGIFNDFFALITNIAVDYYIIIPILIIMWAIDKKKGIFAYVAYGIGSFINAIIKSTFCVYRPWIRSSEIKPLDSAMHGVASYSFPSGHSTSTSSVYLGIRHGFKKYNVINTLCIVMIVITMFSRCFLGVHTPQDVLVGLAIGIVSVFILSVIEKYLDKNPKKDWIFVALMAILTAACLAYCGLKKYPMDYVDGKLLVDPSVMVIDSFKDPGTFFGVVLAWFIEKRYINYSIEGSSREKIERCVIGIFLMCAYYTIFINGISKAINVNIVYFIFRAILPILAICIYPLTWKVNKK